jgi:hypothetical protein
MIFLVWKTPKKYFSPNRVQTPEKTSHQKSHTQHCTKKQKLYITFHSACLDILSDVSRAHLCVKFSPLYTHSPFFLFVTQLGKLLFHFIIWKRKKKRCVSFFYIFVTLVCLTSRDRVRLHQVCVCVYTPPSFLYCRCCAYLRVSYGRILCKASEYYQRWLKRKKK